ncbi:helix-turn-helix domain-containing protein [Flavobacterium chilense]|uniref:Helix-turn-helix domain-containing protein n=1 Tax=Flavobacterium chilense TaxID=946677 RepID=A0A1M7DQI2_9FLAO|nr:helix-turn-helix domain-containing protein [Flavobacterium chilense]SHL81633.1 Helix-turn-helix domain-containing protein [Flavobacterium chilense]
MDTNIAVITVPLQDWNDIKTQLNNISKSILEIKNKGQKENLTPKEAMEVLKCSRNTLQSYIDKGFFNVIKMKSEKYSKVIIKRADIDFFIESRA